MSPSAVADAVQVAVIYGVAGFSLVLGAAMVLGWFRGGRPGR